MGNANQKRAQSKKRNTGFDRALQRMKERFEKGVQGIAEKMYPNSPVLAPVTIGIGPRVRPLSFSMQLPSNPNPLSARISRFVDVAMGRFAKSFPCTPIDRIKRMQFDGSADHEVQIRERMHEFEFDEKSITAMIEIAWAGLKLGLNPAVILYQDRRKKLKIECGPDFACTAEVFSDGKQNTIDITALGGDCLAVRPQVSEQTAGAVEWKSGHKGLERLEDFVKTQLDEGHVPNPVVFFEVGAAESREFAAIIARMLSCAKQHADEKISDREYRKWVGFAYLVGLEIFVEAMIFHLRKMKEDGKHVGDSDEYIRNELMKCFGWHEDIGEETLQEPYGERTSFGDETKIILEECAHAAMGMLNIANRFSTEGDYYSGDIFTKAFERIMKEFEKRKAA